MRLIANISLLFAERPMRERFAAAREAGFAGIEIQFPYDEDAERLRRWKGDTPLVLINLPAGRPDLGDVGLSTDAARRRDFAAGLETALRYAETLRVEKVNVLAGAPPPGQPDSDTVTVLGDNLRLAAERMAGIGVRVVIEAVNPFDVPGYWLDGLDRALAFLDGLESPAADLQFDLYHMARTEPDLANAIHRAGPLIGHVQFADAPGRREPGTGAIDFAAAFAALHAIGYDGAVGAEYRPTLPTERNLGWMAQARRWMEQAG